MANTINVIGRSGSRGRIMVLTNDAKNRVRDLVNSDISSGSLGTDSTTPTAADTDLGTEVSATSAATTNTTGNKTINVGHVLTSTISVGTTFKEGGVYMNSDAILLNHVIFPDFAHTANDELHTTYVMRID